MSDSLTTSEVLTAVRERSGSSALQISQALGVEPREVVPALNRLLAEKRVERFERERSSNVARWRAT